MMVWEICKGSYALSMDGTFQRAQRLANETGQPVVMKSQITITPPNGSNGVGEIQYKNQLQESADVSPKYKGLYKDGELIADGPDEAAAVTRDLFDDHEETAKSAQETPDQD